MSPDALKAAGDTRFAEIHVLLAWQQGSAPQRLVGLWALKLRKIAPLWPALLEAPPYNYAFLSNPVVDPAFVAEVIPAFFAAIANSNLPKIISLRDLDAESPSYDAIISAAGKGRGPLKITESARPVATPSSGVKKAGSTRKKLRQDWNRLSGIGTVDVVIDRRSIEVVRAFETFLALENMGWKGAEGTAILCNFADASFARRLVGNLAERGKTSVALLRIDGVVIAAQVLMYCGSTAYTWKTAFDPKYAKYSPGAVLVDKATEQLFATPGIEAIDSCSVETGFMGQLWEGRRKMVDLLVDVGSGHSHGYAFEAARRRGYQRLRELRDRLRAVKKQNIARLARRRQVPSA